MMKVSDHAVVRWLERIKGVDMDAVREEILADGRGATVEFLGEATGEVPIPGHKEKLVCVGGVVVTVTTHNIRKYRQVSKKQGAKFRKKREKRKGFHSAG